MATPGGGFGTEKENKELLDAFVGYKGAKLDYDEALRKGDQSKIGGAKALLEDLSDAFSKDLEKNLNAYSSHHSNSVQFLMTELMKMLEDKKTSEDEKNIIKVVVKLIDDTLPSQEVENAEDLSDSPRTPEDPIERAAVLIDKVVRLKNKANSLGFTLSLNPDDPESYLNPESDLKEFLNSNPDFYKPLNKALQNPLSSIDSLEIARKTILNLKSAYNDAEKLILGEAVRLIQNQANVLSIQKQIKIREQNKSRKTQQSSLMMFDQSGEAAAEGTPKPKGRPRTQGKGAPPPPPTIHPPV